MVNTLAEVLDQPVSFKTTRRVVNGDLASEIAHRIFKTIRRMVNIWCPD